MTTGPKRDRQAAAGVVDAAMASLATFAAGITGVNLLSDTDRGVYGIFFTVFVLGVVLVNQLIYIPSQVIAIGQDRERRLSGIRKTMGLAAGPSLAAGSVSLLAANLNRSQTTSSVLLALTATVAVTIPLSALQDYVRRSLHIAERSWQAAAVSVMQLVGVGISIAVLLATDIERAWIPFGSLGFANILSVSVGLVLAGAHHRTDPPEDLSFRRLVTSGKWLVARSAIPAAAAFVAANLLTRLAGAATFGHAEAARQVARPVIVLSIGLGAVMGPRAVRAGSRGDRAAARRNRRKYGFAVALAAAAYIALAGPDWVGNPMSRIIPSAYEVPWLVAATVLGNAIVAILILPKNELIGASKANLLAGLALVSSPMLLITAASAGTTGAFARPMGLILEGIIVMVGAEWLLKRHYASGPNDGSPPMVPSDTLL